MSTPVNANQPSKRVTTLVDLTLPGLAGGMMFAMFAMIVAIWTSTFWAPPQGIAQAVGIGPNGHDFHAVPFVLGLMGHMMNSVLLGSAFVLVARRLRLGLTTSTALGVMYGLALWGLLYYVLLPDVFHLWAAAGVDSFTGAVPAWAWVVGHAIFGMVLGALAAVRPARLWLSSRNRARPFRIDAGGRGAVASR